MQVILIFWLCNTAKVCYNVTNGHEEVPMVNTLRQTVRSASGYDSHCEEKSGGEA